MPIPTIPNSAMVPDQQIGTKRNARPQIQALGASKQLIGSAAGTIEGAASEILSYEQNKQKAEDVYAFNRMAVQTRGATQDFAKVAKATSDDDSIVPQWQDKSQSVIDDTMANPKLRGKARDKIYQHLLAWQAASTASFQTLADIKGGQRREAGAFQAAQSSLTNYGVPIDQRIADANKHFDMTLRAGDLTSEKAAEAKAQFPAQAQQFDAIHAIEMNPYQAREMLNGKGKDGNPTAWPLLKPEARDKLVTEANTRTNQAQSATLNQLRNSYRQNPLNPPADEYLDQLEDTGQLSPQGRDAFDALVSQKHSKTVSEDANKAWMDIRNEDLSDPKTRAKKVADLNQAITRIPDSGKQKMLAEYLDGRERSAKAGERTQERPVETQVLDALHKDFQEKDVVVPMDQGGATVPGGLKWLNSTKTTDADVAGLFGKGKTKDSVIEAVRAHQADLTAKMRGWLDDPSNAKATFEQANEFRQSLEQPYAMDAAKAAVSPPPRYTKGQTGTAAGGKKVRWDGAEWVEDK